MLSDAIRIAAVLALPVVVLGSQQGDEFDAFVTVCVEAFAQNPMMDEEGARVLCTCVAKESRSSGVDPDGMAEITQQLKRDPNYEPDDEKVKQAGRACLERMLEEVNRQADETRAEEIARRNETPVVPVRYTWTGYKQLPGAGSEEVAIPPDEETTISFADDAACTVGKVELREGEEDGLVMIQATRPVSCRGVQVDVSGTREGSMYVSCAHSRDLESAYGALATFKLYPPGGSELVGSLMIVCHIEPMQ